MGNIDQAEAKAILNSSVKGDAYTAPSGDILLALMTAMGANSATPGTEVVNSGGSSYAKQPITFGSATNDSSTGGAQISNAATVNFTNMPAVSGSGIVGIELWDSGDPAVRRWFGGLLANKVVNAGDTVTFNTGSLTIKIS